MTRVLKWQLEYQEVDCKTDESSTSIVNGEGLEDTIRAAHFPNYLRVDRTIYLAQQIRNDMSWEEVRLSLLGAIHASTLTIPCGARVLRPLENGL